MVSIGSQFSTGDQGDGKYQFWLGGFRKCPKCGNDEKGNIKSTNHSAGCRMNGDAYGTEVYECLHCKWQTSFQYDEASDSYFYETKFWSRDPPPPIPEQQLDAEMVKKFVRIGKMLKSKYQMRTAMEQDGIPTADIEAFIKEHANILPNH